MGMFDWYKPVPDIISPVTQQLLSEWQSKDGPCALFVWQQGHISPIEHLYEEELKWNEHELSRFRLPQFFEIYTYENNFDIKWMAKCQCIDGIWQETILQIPKRIQMKKRSL